MNPATSCRLTSDFGSKFIFSDAIDPDCSAALTDDFAHTLTWSQSATFTDSAESASTESWAARMSRTAVSSLVILPFGRNLPLPSPFISPARCTASI
ncbi:hypothetical protein D3C81_813230 [compost metagenome]